MLQRIYAPNTNEPYDLPAGRAAALLRNGWSSVPAKPSEVMREHVVDPADQDVVLVEDEVADQIVAEVDGYLAKQAATLAQASKHVDFASVVVEEQVLPALPLTLKPKRPFRRALAARRRNREVVS
jgi:hypothetical protein